LTSEDNDNVGFFFTTKTEVMMRLKKFVMNVAMGLFTFASTTGLISILKAGTCVSYCDDQVEWVNHEFHQTGQAMSYRCSKYESRFQRFIYNDDSTYDDRTLTTELVEWKSYIGTSCTATCEGSSYPRKATGSPVGNVLNTGEEQNGTCTMKNS
jgi:hypothetical protein